MSRQQNISSLRVKTAFSSSATFLAENHARSSPPTDRTNPLHHHQPFQTISPMSYQANKLNIIRPHSHSNRRQSITLSPHKNLVSHKPAPFLDQHKTYTRHAPTPSHSTSVHLQYPISALHPTTLLLLQPPPFSNLDPKISNPLIAHLDSPNPPLIRTVKLIQTFPSPMSSSGEVTSYSGSIVDPLVVSVISACGEAVSGWRVVLYSGFENEWEGVVRSCREQSWPSGWGRNLGWWELDLQVIKLAQWC